MKVFSQKGEILPYHNGSGSTITSGTTVKKGARVGVVTGDILDGADGEILVQGVATVVTDTGTAWTDGDPVWWDDTNHYWTKTKTTGNVPGGTAVGAKASGAATATVRLEQQAGPGLAATVGTVTAAAAATAGGSGPTAGQVDTGIATAIAPLTTGINAILTALKNAGIMATA